MSGRELEGKVALVTGGSRGIGLAIAQSLAEAGARVAVVDIVGDRALTAAAELPGEGHAGFSCDVAYPDQVRATLSEVEEAIGPVDILVNNAGTMSIAPLAKGRVEDWTRMVEVNINGVLRFVSAVLPTMLERESGHIVSVGSLAGRRPFPGGGVYAATKFAVRALSWAMHLELGAAHGIRITDVQPGLVATELLDGDPETAAAWDAAWAGRRVLQPEDVARAIVFATTSPDHVSVSEILVRPTDQPT